MYSFVPASDDFPFVERMVSLQRPSRELFGVFENILSQGMRIEALSEMCASRDQMDLLPFVVEHPVFSFRKADGETTSVRTKRSKRSTMDLFPEFPFERIVHGILDIRESFILNPEERHPEYLSDFSGMQDKFVVVFSQEGVRLPQDDEMGNAIMKSAGPSSVHSRLSSFVLNEHLFTALASRAGIPSAKTVVFKNFENNDIYLLSKRFDISQTGERILCVEGAGFF